MTLAAWVAETLDGETGLSRPVASVEGRAWWFHAGPQQAPPVAASTIAA
ncbi:MAG: hypothetical protein WBV39_16640 [Rudaea sp.]